MSPPEASALVDPQSFALGDSDLERLYEDAPCGYLTLLDDGVIIRVNDAYLAWSGKQRDDVLGARFQTLLPVGDRILFDTHVRPQLRLAGSVSEVAVDILAVNGRRAAFLNAVRVPASAGRPALTRVIVFGARERRQYEKELLTALRRAEAADADRRAAEAELAHRSRHDALTGLPNREGFASWLEELRTGQEGNLADLSVLLLDVAGVAAVEGELDASAAEEFVTAIVARIRETTESSAGLARLAAGKFLIADLFPREEWATFLAVRLLDALAEPVRVGDLDVMAEASIGIAPLTYADEDLDSLLHRAGAAQADARRRRTTGWQLDTDRAEGRCDRQKLRTLSELRRAIPAGDLVIHYQPQWDLPTGRLHGVEALVRWQHPSRGLLPPGEFIDWAEESGLVNSLGAHVLERAVAQAARWDADGLPALAMSVNLSARQLGSNHLVDVVANALTHSGLDPARLVLEITETALMSDAAVALGELRKLKQLGVQLSLDDFGTGYSSLGYLRQFPLDELKIDRSFVSTMHAGAAGHAIVASCIQLGHAMDLRVVAEGIETVEEQRALVVAGCDVGQGFGLARPAAAEDIVRLLR